MKEGFISDSYLEDMAKDASSAVIRMMAKELLEHRRAQQPASTPVSSEDARMLAVILKAVDDVGSEWVADSKRINDNLARSGAISGYVNTRTPVWVARVKVAIRAAMQETDHL